MLLDEIEIDILSRIDDTYLKLHQIANDRGYNAILPTNTLFIRDIVKKANLFYLNPAGEINVNGLLMIIEQMKIRDPDLLRWLFIQAKGSTPLQLDYRSWLIQHGISLSMLLPYFETSVKDRIDFGIGILLGCFDSLAVENIQGWFDLAGLTIDLGSLLTNYEKERLIRMIQSFKNSFEHSEEKLESSIAEFKNQFNPNLKEFDPGEAISSIEDLKEKIISILLASVKQPMEEILEADKNDLDVLYTSLLELVGQIDISISSIWNYAVKKLKTEIKEKATQEILKFNFTKAGYIYGREYTNIAQLLIGIAKLLYEAGKITVKGTKWLSNGFKQLGANQRYVLALLLASVTSPGSKIHLLKAERAAIIMAGKSKAEIASFKKGIQGILSNEIKHFESGQIKAVEGSLAVEIAQQNNIVLPAGCSSTAENTHIILSLSVTLHFLIKGRRRRKGEEEKSVFKDPSEEGISPDKWNGSFRSFSHHPLFKKIASQVEMPYEENLDKKTILSKFVEKMRIQFETEIITSKRKYKRKGIYTRFNYYLSNHLKRIRAEAEKEGSELILLIDERFGKRLNVQLDPNQYVVFNKKRFTIQEIHDMTILEFYDNFFENHKLSELYGKFANPLKNNEPELYHKWQYLREQLPLETNIEAKEILMKEFEKTAEKMASVIKKQKIDQQLSMEEIEELIYGKLNLDGLCKNARPDFSLINSDGPDMTFDFIHRRLDFTDPKHFLGTTFYNDFNMVIYGKDYDAIIEDIPYTFSKGFLTKLIE